MKISEVVNVQVKAKDKIPALVKPTRGPEQKHPYRGKLVGEEIETITQDKFDKAAGEKIRHRHIKSGHNKKVKQFLHDEGMKVIKQWRDQLIAKFPRIAKRRIPLGKGPFSSLIPDVLSPISLVKDVVSDGNLKRVAKWWGGGNAINSAGIDSMKTRMFYRTEVAQASQEILLKLLPQIDIEKIKAIYTDPNILDEDESNKKKDACYHKVKSRYKVWPSAYASGALVKCRKVGAKNWGNSKNK